MIRIRRRGRRAASPPQSPRGPDIVRVTAYGDNVPGLQLYALQVAHEFYGPDARLVAGAPLNINSSSFSRPGRKFLATVFVRNLDGVDAAPVQDAPVPRPAAAA